MIGKLCAVALPGVPLLAGVVGLLLPRSARRLAAWLAIGSTTVTALLALFCMVDALGSFGFLDIRFSSTDVSFTPAQFGSLPVTVTLRLDALSALMVILVAVIALMVQVYSTQHLARDRRYAPYAAQMTLFTGAMLLVVSSSDLITLLIGWELMGLCSYLLIGHDRTNPASPSAARKAFVMTRIGDVGFLLGAVLLAANAGSFRFDDVLATSQQQTAAGLLLLWGIVGKSAQFPLQAWLPDAMAGPTPVSALIHSATMVAAGVYVMARLDPIFTGSDTVRVVTAIVGAVSILLGSLAALAGDDLKRVLAWSTISQLGYMICAVALGAGIGVPLFHLFSHAVFKALLFLCAGAVIVASGGSAMAKMGGLRHKAPITAICTAVGLASLAGAPPLSGFWSKGFVLSIAAEAAADGSGASAFVGWVVIGAGLAAVPITAFYCMRVWLLVFAGRYRGVAEPTDPSAVTLGTLIALAIPAALLGVVATFGQRGAWWSLADDDYTSYLFAPKEIVTPLLDVLLVAVGVLGAWVLWRRSTAADESADPARFLGRLRPALASGLYADTWQRALVVQPMVHLSRAFRGADERGVDGAVRALGRSIHRLAGVTAAAHGSAARYVSFAAGGAALVALVALVAGVWHG